MIKSAVPFRVALILAGFLIAESIAGLLLSVVFIVLSPGLIDPEGPFAGLTPVYLLPIFLRIVVFGFGVFQSLRFVAPIDANDSWYRAIARGAIATLFGVAAVIVLGLAQALANTVTPGTYPFGYSLSPTVDPQGLPQGILRAFEGGLDPLIYWVVPVVLAAVLLKVWLGAQVAKVTAPASVFAKP